MTAPRVQRPSLEAAVGRHGRSIRDDERTPGEWVIVGAYPGDPGTVPESPPFQNFYADSGIAGYPPVSFYVDKRRRVHLRGALVLGSDDPISLAGISFRAEPGNATPAASSGTVALTLPEPYRPAKSEVFSRIQVDPNGDVVVLDSTSASPFLSPATITLENKISVPNNAITTVTWLEPRVGGGVAKITTNDTPTRNIVNRNPTPAYTGDVFKYNFALNPGFVQEQGPAYWLVYASVKIDQADIAYAAPFYLWYSIDFLGFIGDFNNNPMNRWILADAAITSLFVVYGTHPGRSQLTRYEGCYLRVRHQFGAAVPVSVQLAIEKVAEITSPPVT